MSMYDESYDDTPGADDTYERDDMFADEMEQDVSDEPWDGFRDDVEADADALRSIGWGTDEDYGGDFYDMYDE